MGEHAGVEGQGGEEISATEPGKKDGAGGDGEGKPREGLYGEEEAINVDDGFDLWIGFGMGGGRHMILHFSAKLIRFGCLIMVYL